MDFRLDWIGIRRGGGDDARLSCEIAFEFLQSGQWSPPGFRRAAIRHHSAALEHETSGISRQTHTAAGKTD